MVDDGSVNRDIVLCVLESGGVVVDEEPPKPDGSPRAVTFTKGDLVEVQVLPERVPRRLVLRFAHKFEVAPHFFWHPEKLPADQQRPGQLSN